MCGIAGILGTSDGFAVDEELVTTMRELIHHRGPDDGGSWHSPEDRVALAHRRLSIIDLSADRPPADVQRGRHRLDHLRRRDLQPHGDPARARGEGAPLPLEHRHRDDRPPVRGGGHPLRRAARTGCSTSRSGTRGTKELFLARDRLGKKPLYYAQPPGGLVFGSEIKALLAHPALTAELDEEAFFHYLTFVCTPAPMTMFKGVRKLGPAERMTVRADGSTEVETFWSPFSRRGGRRGRRRWSEPELEERLLELLRESIRRRMMSDVPFGVFLSGGVDSSTNVALMSELMDAPVRTFSVGFERYERYNELEHARTIARKFGTDHHEVVIDAHDLESFLPELIYHQDEPLADWVACRCTTSRSSRATTGRSSSRSARARTSSSTATRRTTRTPASTRRFRKAFRLVPSSLARAGVATGVPHRQARAARPGDRGCRGRADPVLGRRDRLPGRAQGARPHERAGASGLVPDRRAALGARPATRTCCRR